LPQRHVCKWSDLLENNAIMSVRKRTWKNRDGSQGEAWVVAYADQAGKRHMKNFDRRRDADAFHASVSTDLRSGIHVPDSQSVMVAEAGRCG
jgi:integrase